MSSEKGLSESTLIKLLTMMAEKADQGNRDRSSFGGGIICNVIDDCRRLLAEAARAEGMPNLDRFYGREPVEERAENADSIFDIWDGMERMRPFPRLIERMDAETAIKTAVHMWPLTLTLDPIPETEFNKIVQASDVVIPVLGKRTKRIDGVSEDRREWSIVTSIEEDGTDHTG